MTGLIESTLYLSVTAVVILLFKWIFKNKLSAKWHVWIWALLALRLVLPSLPESSFSIFNAIDIPKTSQPTQVEIDVVNEPSAEDVDRLIYGETQSVPPQTIEKVPVSVPEIVDVTDVKPVMPSIKPNDAELEKIENSKNQADSVSSKSEKVQKKTVSADIVVRWAYRVGVVVLFVYFVIVYLVCITRIRKNGKSADKETLRLLEECKKKTGVSRKVYAVEYGNNPMLMGLVKPTVVLPDGYTEDEKRNIIIHELCHLKGGDIYLIWLSMIVLCFNWFNPIMWICFFLFRRDIEVYCDERVLKYIDSKKDYASLLVKTALRRNSFIAGTTSLKNGEKEVERRVKYMAYFKKPGFLWTALIVVVAVIIGVVCLTDPKRNVEKEAENVTEKGVEKDESGYDLPEDYIYNRFLENDISVKIDNVDYTMSEYVERHGIRGMKMQYAFFDMNGDGVLEFHLKSPRSYDIFTVNDMGFELWYEGLPYENFTSDGNILYYRNGGAPNNRQYIFKELDYDGNVVSEVAWSVYELDDRGNITADTVFYNGDGKEISKDEYFDLINKYGSCMKDHPIWQELGVKEGKVLENTANFYLEEKSPNEYYCKVYDNNGNILLSETTEKWPAFRHLEGPLYELQISHGTSSWECKYFNVETGYKSEAYDKPFYLDNGVIAYVNSYPKFELSKEDMYFIKLVNLYNNYEMMGYSADYLKSSTSWIIEYIDDTHISVTYYTENGNKENVEVLEIPSLTDALTEEDFKITYKGFTFDLDTTVEQVMEYFPTEEIENVSYVSGSPAAKRFCLSYPNAREPDIRIICIQNHETGEQFIETIEIVSENIETVRGIKPGDSIFIVATNYGNGNSANGSGVNFGSETYYFENGRSISFVDYWDDDSLINHVTFKYCPDSPESYAIDIYQKSLTGEAVSSLPIDGKINLLYTSGAGAWGDYITLSADGSYTRSFHDENVGEIGKENPNGTVYFDNETGIFDLLKLDDYTYMLTVKESTHEYGYLEERIEYGVKHVSTAPEHSDVGAVYILALPGTPIETIPVSVMDWDLNRRIGYVTESTLTYYALYPYSGGIGYFAYESINDEADEEFPEYTMNSTHTSNAQPTQAPVSTEEKIEKTANPIPEVVPAPKPVTQPTQAPIEIETQVKIPEPVVETVPEVIPEVVPETPSETEENAVVSEKTGLETETDASGLFDEENETPPLLSEEPEQNGEETLSDEVEVQTETNFW